jgi:hypothetical protein
VAYFSVNAQVGGKHTAPQYPNITKKSSTMNMKLTYSIIILSMLFSCKSTEEQNIIQMETSVKQYFNDFAFKENTKLQILELKNYGYSTISENTIDSAKISVVLEKIKHFESMMESQLEIQKSKSQQLKLAVSLGNKTLTDIYNEDVQKAFKELSKYNDSAKRYAKIDSTIRHRIETRKNSEAFYKAKFFIKATATKDGKSENMLDTLHLFFDKSFKLLSMDNP